MLRDVLITSLIVFGFVSERSQVCGDFINPLNYVRYERAVIQVGKRSTIGSYVTCARENKWICA